MPNEDESRTHFVSFPNWKTMLWLATASYMLGNMMWIFVDGWSYALELSNFKPRFIIEDFLFSSAFCLLSVTYSWLVLKFFPMQTYSLKVLTVYTFILFLLNNIMAFGCYYLMFDTTESNTEAEFLKLTFSTAMTAAFISCIYFNMQYMRNNTELMATVAKEREAKLEAQLQMLKLQISPHFMFNNFSILSELINEDTQAAEKFVSHISKVYRYVLQNAETTVVSIREELTFLQSYLALIKLRYANTVIIDIESGMENIQGMLPPMSLQLLVENAIKHNKRSTDEPLCIKIYHETGHIFVANNINLIGKTHGTQKGQVNILQRYALLQSAQPTIVNNGEKYIVMLPVISLSK